MNRFFTLLLVASCLTAFGQVTYPYNPDGNADAFIGVTDGVTRPNQGSYNEIKPCTHSDTLEPSMFSSEQGR